MDPDCWTYASHLPRTNFRWINTCWETFIELIVTQRHAVISIDVIFVMQESFTAVRCYCWHLQLVLKLSSEHKVFFYVYIIYSCVCVCVIERETERERVRERSDLDIKPQQFKMNNYLSTHMSLYNRLCLRWCSSPLHLRIIVN